MRNLDWQHVALTVVAALCLAGIWWAGVKLPAPGLVAVGLSGTGMFVTQVLSLLKASPVAPPAARLVLPPPLPQPEDKPL